MLIREITDNRDYNFILSKNYLLDKSIKHLQLRFKTHDTTANTYKTLLLTLLLKTPFNTIKTTHSDKEGRTYNIKNNSRKPPKINPH